jgi:hypothetical protein
LTRPKASKASDFDFIVGLQRRDDAVEYRFDDGFGLFSRQLRNPRHLFDELCLRHRMFFVFVDSRSFCHRDVSLLFNILGRLAYSEPGWDAAYLCISSNYVEVNEFHLGKKNGRSPHQGEPDFHCPLMRLRAQI